MKSTCQLVLLCFCWSLENVCLEGPFKRALIDPSKPDLWQSEGHGQLREMAGNGMNMLCVGHLLLFVLAATDWCPLGHFDHSYRDGILTAADLEACLANFPG